MGVKYGIIFVKDKVVMIHEHRFSSFLFVAVFSVAGVFGIMPVFGANQNIVVNTSQPYSEWQHTCDAGKYLPANSTQCAGCPGTTKYCPGGRFQKSESDQGIFNCPTNTVTDTSGAACMIKLSKDMMKYGQNGKKKAVSEQCWTQSGIRNYAQCVTKHIKNKSGFASGQNITVPKLKPEEMPMAQTQQAK